MSHRRFFTAAGLACLAAAALHAQVAGRVTGTVVDATGAAVPGAAVSLQLPGSGSAAYSTVSSSSGDFTILTVSPGTYDLAVEAKGFLKSVISGLKVDPNRALDVPAVKLDIA